MLLAQAAADAAAQVPWWVNSLLVPIVVGIVGGLIGSAGSMLGGWFLLKRTEFYRKASRWEPMAERLWQERFAVYDRLIAAADELGRAVEQESLKELRIANVSFTSAQNRLFAFGGGKVFQLSNPLLRVLHEMTSSAEDNGMGTISKEQWSSYTSALGDVLAAVRVDLGIETLDVWSDKWFMRTKGEEFHDKYRESVLKKRRQASDDTATSI